MLPISTRMCRVNTRATKASLQIEVRGVDLVLGLSSAWAVFLLLGPARGFPGSVQSTIGFACFLFGIFLWRLLEARWPRHEGLRWVAGFWLLPAVSLGHGLLNPLLDAFHLRLLDSHLAAWDLRIFGVHPAVYLEGRIHPGLMDVLLVCYYGHFVWPLCLGVVLFSQNQRRAFDEYLIGLSLFFALNFAAYVWVPAVGPRFFLASLFAHPLQGLWLTPYLDSLMRLPHFMRDCFPSGHTGGVLLVGYYAWRFSRRFFYVMLLPGLGLILATLAGRFHYGVDLLAVVPLVVFCAVTAYVLRPRS